MRKLGKKEHEMLETVEAYCTCTSGCIVSCSCGCQCSKSIASASGRISLSGSNSTNNKYAANTNVTNGTVYNS